jgi:hypothetical protein
VVEEVIHLAVGSNNCEFLHSNEFQQEERKSNLPEVQKNVD